MFAFQQNYKNQALKSQMFIVDFLKPSSLRESLRLNYNLCGNISNMRNKLASISILQFLRIYQQRWTNRLEMFAAIQWRHESFGTSEPRCLAAHGNSRRAARSMTAARQWFFFLQYPIGFRALYEWNGRDFTVIRSIDHADRTRSFVCGKVGLTARVNINTRFTLIKKIHNSFLSSIDRSVFYNASYELIYCSNYRN